MRELFDFIEKSPSVFHVVENLKEMAKDAGYEVLTEAQDWQLKPGGKYAVTRNDSAIVAFSIPADFKPEETKDGVEGFHIVASHSDSPTFKIKENAEMKMEGHYVKLNTEKYGGMILNSWLDRALSVAGRVTFEQDGKIESRLVNVDRDLLVIPNLAIHMKRGTADNVELNPQVDMLPLFSEEGGEKDFLHTIGEAAGVDAEEILSYDLFLYVREKCRSIGANGEYILSPKLDDLQCAYTSMKAMIESEPRSYINICAVFDNEEVGSGTRQGADSTFLEDVLARVQEAFGKKDSWVRQNIAGGLLISADNAHAVHPNHPEKADPTNRPYLNGGIVVKYHGSQRYTTDAYTAAAMKALCKEAEVPVQIYTNRSDIAGGSTLGNISTAHVSIPSVDIGLPQLAMHSAVETAGAKDTEYAIRVMKVFFGK